MLRTLRPSTFLKALALAVLAFAAVPDAASAQVLVYESEEAAGYAATVADKSETLEAIGIGLAVLGGGIGIGLCGFAATGAMARQPEIAGQIQTAMLIAAVLIEGATIIGLAFCLAA